MELNSNKQSKTGYRAFIHKKLKPLKTGLRRGVPVAVFSSYPVKSLGLHLKAFFLCLSWSSLRKRALDPLSESGGTPIHLLLFIVVALLVLPLFFNFNAAIAGRGDAIQMEAAPYSNAKEVVPSIKGDNINPHGQSVAPSARRHRRKSSLRSLPSTTVSRLLRQSRRFAPRPALSSSSSSIPPDFTRGSTALKEVSFTFDGGSHRGQTKQILDILKRRSIKTTIFLTGIFIEKNPALVRRMLRDGHEIGNHMMTHSHMTSYVKNGRHRTLPKVNKSFVVRELLEAANIFERVTGEKMAPLWRAPYGELNKEIRGWAYNSGFVHVGWTADYSARESLDSLDWVSNPNSRLFRTPAQMTRRILGFGKGRHELKGGIALMHLGTSRKGEKLADRLGWVIDELHGRGYRFVKASTLIKGRKDMAAYLLGTDHIAMLEDKLRPAN